MVERGQVTPHRRDPVTAGASPLRRPRRDRGVRPGPARAQEAHPGPRITRIRSPPLTVTATSVAGAGARSGSLDQLWDFAD